MNSPSENDEALPNPAPMPKDTPSSRNTAVVAGWAKNTAATVADEGARLGKEAVRSDLAKDAAAGAAIGAVIAIPIPVIGPLTGAVLGAAIGVYRNFTRKGAPSLPTPDAPPRPSDLYANLLKLRELKEKGILSEAEFETQKRKLLASDT